MHLILHNGDFKGFGDIFYKIVVLLWDLFLNGKTEGRENLPDAVSGISNSIKVNLGCFSDYD